MLPCPAAVADGLNLDPCAPAESALSNLLAVLLAYSFLTAGPVIGRDLWTERDGLVNLLIKDARGREKREGLLTDAVHGRGVLGPFARAPKCTGSIQR